MGTDDEALLAASEAVVDSDDVPELAARSASLLPRAKKLRSRRTKISSSDISLDRLVGGAKGKGRGSGEMRAGGSVAGLVSGGR